MFVFFRAGGCCDAHDDERQAHPEREASIGFHAVVPFVCQVRFTWALLVGLLFVPAFY